MDVETIKDIKTDPKILKKIEAAAKKRMTPEEVRRQKVSYIMGSLSEGNKMTRADVEAVLDRLPGAPIRR